MMFLAWFLKTKKREEILCKYFEKCSEDEICMSPAKLYMGVMMQVNS